MGEIPNKVVYPRIYSIVFQNEKEHKCLSAVAYSLEEAHMIIMNRNSNRTVNEKDAIVAYDFCELDDALHELTSLNKATGKAKNPTQKKNTRRRAENKADVNVSKHTEKNLLMTKIIDEKDLNLLEENKGYFTEPEMKYIRNLIEKNNRKKK